MVLSPAERKQRNLGACEPGNSAEFLQLIAGHPAVIRAGAEVTGCLAGGYAPRGYGLADFSLIRRKGIFHLFHIPRVPGNSCIDLANEHWLGHATSTDLDTWTTGDPVLSADPAHAYESSHVWAPCVLDRPDGALMAYTGLSAEPSQVICLARSTDPDLRVWNKLPGNPLFPLTGLEWHFRNAWGHVRMGRDPHLVMVGDHALLAYTGMHRNGCPVVGGMISRDFTHWEDIGPILYRPMTPGGWMPESVNIQPLDDGRWALIASISPGLDYYLSDDPHHWHGLRPQRVAYADGDPHDLVAPEVIARRGGVWLMAFFLNSSNRLYIGELDTTTAPWRMRRLTAPSDVATWLAS